MKIPYARQMIDQSDIDAVIEVLQSDWLTQGPCIPALEAALAATVGAAHVVAVTSGTAGLHLACQALGLGPGDRLWTTPLSFVASSNCGLYCGADVDFIDIDPDTGLMSLEVLAVELHRARLQGTLPKIVVAVHYAGLVLDMVGLFELAREFGFRIIEDAAHALGAVGDGITVGTCRHSDVAVFSFHPVKHITTGEGGAVATQNPLLAQRLSLLRSHGITRDAALMKGESEGDWYYEQVELGFNYRMTDLQAALGVSQLRRLDAFLTRRRHLAERYSALLEGLPVKALPPSPDAAWHLYPVRVEARQRKDVFNAMRRGQVIVNVHYLPIYLQPYYRRLGFQPGRCPQAEVFYDGLISLPMYAGLEDAAQDRVVQLLAEALA